MLNIIIYSNNIATIRKSNKAINMALVNYEFEYSIYEINKCNDSVLTDIINNKNKKIYIIDVANYQSCNVASMIREKDFTSIIILVNMNIEKYDMFLDKRLIVFDFISSKDNYLNRLIDDINLSLKIIYGEEIFVFKYNHMIYRIPYNSINYIEKESSVKRCIIHTNDKKYYIVSSIEKIMNDLDINFVKTHQSCIVNINNVSELDFSNNIIIFKNGDNTSLLTDKVKKTLKKYVDC